MNDDTPKPVCCHCGERDGATAALDAAKPTRRSAFGSVHEAPYTDDEREFMVTLDRWKRQNRKPFPTCCEVLAVLKSLGYAKPVEQPLADVIQRVVNGSSCV